MESLQRPRWPCAGIPSTHWKSSCFVLFAIQPIQWRKEWFRVVFSTHMAMRTPKAVYPPSFGCKLEEIPSNGGKPDGVSNQFFEMHGVRIDVVYHWEVSTAPYPTTSHHIIPDKFSWSRGRMFFSYHIMSFRTSAWFPNDTIWFWNHPTSFLFNVAHERQFSYPCSHVLTGFARWD